MFMQGGKLEFLHAGWVAIEPPQCHLPGPHTPPWGSRVDIVAEATSQEGCPSCWTIVGPVP